MDSVENGLVAQGHLFVQEVVVAQVRPAEYMLTRVRIYQGPNGVYLRYHKRRPGEDRFAECGPTLFCSLPDMEDYLAMLGHSPDYYNEHVPLID